MGKRITPAINKTPVHIDNENAILIIDSDEEETPCRPTPKSSSSSFIDVDAISIDLTEDDSPSSHATVKASSQTPPKTESTPILPTWKRSLSSPTPSTSSPIQKAPEPMSKRHQSASLSSNPPSKRTEQNEFSQGKPCSPPTKSPSTTARKVVSQTSVPPSPTNNKSSLKLPEKWNSQSSLESRTAQALLVKMVSSASPKKLSVPRSSLLLKNTTVKRPSSSIVKASSTSPLRRPVSSISASLKRPMESPERPTTTTTSVFTSPSTSSEPLLLSSNQQSSMSSSRPTSSPEQRPTRQTCDPFASPERNPSQMFKAFASSPPRPFDARRLKASSSPRSVKPIERKPSIFVDDDDESEDDLGSFISVVDSSRRRAIVNNTPRNVLSQCPLCYLMFPKNELADHASDCTGSEEKVGQKRGVRKNTIAAAVEMDENERKRLNKGKIDMGPTNYYADSESILATDGTGLNAEVTGMSWESAGQTRFA